MLFLISTFAITQFRKLNSVNIGSLLNVQERQGNLINFIPHRVKNINRSVMELIRCFYVVVTNTNDFLIFLRSFQLTPKNFCSSDTVNHTRARAHTHAQFAIKLFSFIFLIELMSCWNNAIEL